MNRFTPHYPTSLNIKYFQKNKTLGPKKSTDVHLGLSGACLLWHGERLRTLRIKFKRESWLYLTLLDPGGIPPHFRNSLNSA